jgi:hypothetical protein
MIIVFIVLPIESEFLEMVEITGNVFQGRIRDPWTPGDVQGAELAQVLSYEFDTVIRNLGAAGQRQDGQVG